MRVKALNALADSAEFVCKISTSVAQLLDSVEAKSGLIRPPGSPLREPQGMPDRPAITPERAFQPRFALPLVGRMSPLT